MMKQSRHQAATEAGHYDPSLRRGLNGITSGRKGGDPDSLLQVWRRNIHPYISRNGLFEQKLLGAKGGSLPRHLDD